MKQRVGIIAAIEAQRCPQCGLDGHGMLRGEQSAATAERVWRHSVCGHVLMFRPTHPAQQVTLASTTAAARNWLSPPRANAGAGEADEEEEVADLPLGWLG